MQPINQEGNILLAVLLFKADKLLTALGEHLLEVAGDDWRRRVPHAIEKQAEGVD